MLSINLLGSPAVMLDEAPVRGFVSGKAAALLYYLAATGRPHARESLAGLLWPDAPRDRAGRNLRDVLSNLRRLVGPWLEIGRQSVALSADAGVAVDCRLFERAILAGERTLSASDGAAHLRAAVGRYGGEFLAGFALADAPEFDTWATAERERLRQLAMGALLRLASHAGHQGEYLEGADLLARLLALDPTREEAHRQLMLLLALDGQRGAALAQYAACQRILREELGVDPDEATEALHRRILDGELVIERAAPAQHRPISTIPAPLTTLLGRDAEAAQALACLGAPGCRLLSIIGPGGVGKTCLALHVAQQLLAASRRGAAFADGLAFVGLAPVLAGPTDESAGPILAARVAEALGFTFAGPEPPMAQLARHLREKALLLVLDNCEHLPVAGFVVELLEQASSLAIMVTSRRRLNLGGEQIVELEGLAFPSGPLAESRVMLEGYPAIELFRQTARAVNPRLAWTGVAAAAAARICRLVSGLPLAIDLAARLARLMPVEEIADGIAASLEFLQSSRRDLPERHRSLRAVFDHSWELLGQAERRALQQLAVFPASFAREAAAQVADAGLPLLAELVDNSLVRQSAGRYELLEPVRQYAAEQLGAGAERAAVEERHTRYYLGTLAARGAELRGASQQAAAEAILREIEHIRAAWRYAADRRMADLIGRAAEALFFFCEMRSWFREGGDAFARAAGALADAPGPAERLVWGRLLAYQGWCSFQIGRQAEARAMLRQSLAALRPLGVEGELALPLNYLAALAYYSGDYAEAEQTVAEALRVSQAAGLRHGAAVALTIFGQIAALVGDYAEARRYSEASLAIERELGNRWGMAFPLISLGRVAQLTGAHREARRCFQEALAIRQAFGDSRGIALCLRDLGATAAAMADYAEASWFYREALALFQAIGNQAGIVATLSDIGSNALAQGEPERAAESFRRALEAAWQTRAAPRILGVLVAMAAGLAEGDPPRAAGLAGLARAHPAATQEIRDRAEALLSQLALPAEPGPPPNLEDAVRELLG
ncbi:tetratricopeptide repeat protein [Oscillochloris sp. ZM17-4]|uniref:ATP-binding protein n=1 Tax=Oscillochloris sp. ZM17-4 TaxID=2866714 RepID=UPI001C736CCC|nr:BTAD domain-containing putative transcriptional regulator [Oscillochloris sp. ZM17-4]MBX0327345.1 tetratricopeptide repeat protein [Oscillochloris sp. ZM17-4]